MQKDNSTLRRKVALRRAALADMDEIPVILETHGGYGRIWERCYAHVQAGCVFETDPKKTVALAQQRPTWAVYESDCVKALQAGAGAHLTINYLDVDPYGEPWPVFDAFFQRERPRAETLHVVVNDGLRQKVQVGGAWSCESLKDVVMRYGNNLYESYLEVAQILLQEKAAQCGYSMTHWAGYHCGHQGQMSHYRAIFTRQG